LWNIPLPRISIARTQKLTAMRLTQEINTGSMADIAFLLLIFFLVATTIETDTGIVRKLPQIAPPTPAPVHARDILVVLVNRDNKLMVEGREMIISELRRVTKEFIKNEYNLSDLPVVKNIEIDQLGIVPVTTGHIISLRTDRGTSYKMYIAVQNELTAAYNELRNELSLKTWNTPYEDLKGKKKEAIDKVYPLKISEADPV
jgi:biopolymer transport protein ExbD